MTQERFSTLEECCEFARRFDQLAEQKSKEEIKEDVIAMHIALVKHIDEIVNRVYTRHKLSLKCKWALNYTIGSARMLGKVDHATRSGLHYKPFFIDWGQNNSELLIHINPILLFGGADTIRTVVLHEIAHLADLSADHRAIFWKTHIIYMQEEGLLPQGEITENGKQLFLNGKLIATSGSKYSQFGVHNPFLGMYGFWPGKKHFRIKRKMKTILLDAIYSKQLNINIVCNDKR